MSLRITGGELRGRTVDSPRSKVTRPTTDMWREIIFSALADLTQFSDLTVLDLFAGSGILGLEAVSRGATSCVFVENNTTLCTQLNETTSMLLDQTLLDQVNIVPSDVFSFLDQPPTNSVDLILCDPPYDLRACNRVLNRLPSHASTGTLVVFEHDPSEFVMEDKSWTRVWSKEKGDTSVDILRYEG